MSMEVRLEADLEGRKKFLGFLASECRGALVHHRALLWMVVGGDGRAETIAQRKGATAPSIQSTERPALDPRTENRCDASGAKAAGSKPSKP